MRRVRPLIVLCVLVAALSGASGALAESPSLDCNAHQTLTRHYSISQLKTALATMPADIREYSDCYQVIDDQLLKQLGRLVPGTSGGGGGSGSSFLSTPLLILVIVIVIGGGGFAYAAYRRGGGGGGGPQAPTTE